jgi:signal transduction histidine kinase
MDAASHDPGSPRNTQRLQSLGLHAGRIAHDVNNLLTTILGNTGLALRELPPESPARASIQDIELAGRFAADLMAQLLALAGHAPVEARPVNLSHVVADVLRLFKVSLGTNVTVSCELDERLPCIRGDVTQIRQVMMNLMTNAAEAIGDAAGTITVATHPGGAVPANLVCLEVHDTGCGISAAMVERIFDPFFTTKRAGRGLGLSTVEDIVKAHNGTLHVQSAEGHGTRFVVALPACAGGDGDGESRC